MAPHTNLADFIRGHHEVILCEWEAFARTLLPAAAGMTKAGLRDHADEILTAVVRDMESLQTAEEKAAKSKGRGPKTSKDAAAKAAKRGAAKAAKGSTAKASNGTTAKASNGAAAEQHLGALGQLHAVLRIDSGFTLGQVVAEYRALRASVFRLWHKEHLNPTGVLRFNEAIDAALTEAVDRYELKTNQYREQVLGIVSHDLRNPLGGILMGASALSRSEALDDRSARLVARIERSAKRMVRIVGDLLDLTRTRLGAEIAIVRGPADIGAICEMVVAELEGSHPNAVIRCTSHGDLVGEWDSDRLAQVLSNLVGNALQHGDADQPITVDAHAEDAGIVLSVHNAGPPIPDDALQNVFEPMVRNVQHAQPASDGLGLGLFIAKELVTAHRGTIDVTSTAADGTTFTMHLPRHPA